MRISISISLVAILLLSACKATEVAVSTATPTAVTEAVETTIDEAAPSPIETDVSTEVLEIFTDEQGVPLPSLNLPYSNPIDNYFDTLGEAISGDTQSLYDHSSDYALAWEAEIKNAYELLILAVRPGVPEVVEWLENSRSAFFEFVPDMAYAIAYSVHSDAFEHNEYTDPNEFVRYGSITPFAAEMNIVQKYREHAFELFDMLYRAGIEYEFVFEGN